MRLALISSLLPPESLGGAEAYVRSSARSLAERHDVIVLTGTRTEVGLDVPVVHLPRLPHLSPRAPFASRMLWHAFDQWLPHMHYAVSRALRRFQPDVVITHHPQGLSAAVFTAVGAARLPHVHVAHDLNLLCARMSMTRNGRFCSGRCAACRVQRSVRVTAVRRNLSRLIVFSFYMRDWHVRAGIVPSDRAVVIPVGAERGTSRVRRLDGSPTIGFIGSLEPHKGVLTLIEAVRAAGAEWRLLLAGTGSLADVVRSAAGNDDRVEYAGYVEGDAKEAFFDRIDLLVVPSEWEEPAGIVVAEAAVRAIPAVVSDRGGLREAPEAQLFQAGDAHALAAAIESFLGHPDRLEGASKRLSAQQREFEWPTHLGRVEQLLKEVCNDSRR